MSGPPGPRAVFCVVEDRWRSVARARDVLSGRFVCAGRPVDLPLPPPWTGPGLPDDEEWAIEWRKFYYLLDLAHAAAAPRAGDAKAFLETFELLVESFLRDGEPASDPTDVMGRRVQNWIYAWRRLVDCVGGDPLSPGLRRRLRAGIAAHLRWIREGLAPERNHRTLELYSLLLGALAFPDLDPGESLLRFACGALRENALTDLLPDGVHRECSTHYHMTVLRNLLGARENARRFGIELGSDFDERLARACEFALHCHQPSGEIPAFSDADRASHLDLLVLAGRLFGREDFLFAGTRGRRGRPPRTTAPSFPHGGYHVQRSHFASPGDRGRAPRHLLFDCGPLGDGGHGHYDALSLELAVGDRPLVMDPGRYTYFEGSGNWRRWFKGTPCHNTLSVDGLDQTPYRRGRPRGPVARAELLGRWRQPGLDVLVGEVRSPCYDALHRRRILFVADTYWVVEDLVRAPSPHTYEVRFQLAPEAAEGLRLRGDSTALAVETRWLWLGLPEGPAPELPCGVIARTYGSLERAPAVVLRRHGVRSARFVTVLFPRNETPRVPRVLGSGPGQLLLEIPATPGPRLHRLRFPPLGALRDRCPGLHVLELGPVPSAPGLRGRRPTPRGAPSPTPSAAAVPAARTFAADGEAR